MPIIKSFIKVKKLVALHNFFVFFCSCVEYEYIPHKICIQLIATNYIVGVPAPGTPSAVLA